MCYGMENRSKMVLMLGDAAAVFLLGSPVCLWCEIGGKEAVEVLRLHSDLIGQNRK